MAFLNRILRNMGSFVQGMEMHEWLIVAAVVVVFGVVCMRGYGSRKNY